MESTIYFIRHAESPFIFGEEKERPLSKKGNIDSTIGFDLWKNSSKPEIYKCLFESEELKSIQRIKIN